MRRLPLMLLTLPLLLAACAPQPPAGPVLAGSQVADPQGLVVSVSSALPDLVADAGAEAVVSPAPACYFARTSEGLFLDSLFCGPVSRRDGSGPWVQVAVTALEGDLHRAAGVVAVGVQAPGSVALVGPAGERPPADTYLPPPPLTPGSVLSRSQVPSSLLLTARSGWSIRTPDPTGAVSPAISVASSSRTAGFGSGYERLSAPSGSSLLVLELDRRDDVASGDVAFAVDASGAVSPAVLERFVVLVVPEGSSPQLRLSAAGLVQSLDLSDGSRAGSAPRIWNETPQVSLAPAGPAELSFTVPVPRLPDRRVAGDLSVSASLSLSVEPPVLRSPAGRPADPGFLLLPLRVHDVRLSAPSDYVDLALSFTPYLVSGDSFSPLRYEEESLPASQVRMFLQVPETADLLTLQLDVALFWSARSFEGDESGVLEGGSLTREVLLSWPR